MAIIGRTRRTPHPLAGRNEVEDGGTRTFLFREECRPSRGPRAARRVGWESGRGRKSEGRRCGLGRRGEAVVWRYSPLERPQGGAGRKAKGAMATRPAAKGDPRQRQGERDREPRAVLCERTSSGGGRQICAPARGLSRKAGAVEGQERTADRTPQSDAPALPIPATTDDDRKRVTQTRSSGGRRRGQQPVRSAGQPEGRAGKSGRSDSVFGRPSRWEADGKAPGMEAVRPKPLAGSVHDSPAAKRGARKSTAARKFLDSNEIDLKQYH